MHQQYVKIIRQNEGYNLITLLIVCGSLMLSITGFSKEFDAELPEELKVPGAQTTVEWYPKLAPDKSTKELVRFALPYLVSKFPSERRRTAMTLCSLGKSSICIEPTITKRIAEESDAKTLNCLINIIGNIQGSASDKAIKALADIGEKKKEFTPSVLDALIRIGKRAGDNKNVLDLLNQSIRSTDKNIQDYTIATILSTEIWSPEFELILAEILKKGDTTKELTENERHAQVRTNWAIGRHSSNPKQKQQAIAHLANYISDSIVGAAAAFALTDLAKNDEYAQNQFAEIAKIKNHTINIGLRNGAALNNVMETGGESLPWPPLQPNKHVLIKKSLLGKDDDSLKAVFARLELALTSERVRCPTFGLAVIYTDGNPTGVALITPRERINKQGERAEWEFLWTKGRICRTLYDRVIRPIYDPRAGEFRLAIIAITSSPYNSVSPILTREDAAKWFKNNRIEGKYSRFEDLPSTLQKASFKEFYCHAIIYQFTEYSDQRSWAVESNLEAHDHLKKMGIITALESIKTNTPGGK